MRIAHLDTGRDWRGGQGQALLLMREFAAAGHEQLLLAPHGPLLERARGAGLRAVRWDSRGEFDVGAMLSARGHLAAFAPEVAHLHSAHAHALGVAPARGAGVPAVVVSRRVDFRVRQNLFSRLKYALPVDRYLCISEGVRAAMLASGVEAARLALVPSGIDLEAVRLEAEQPVPALRDLMGVARESVVVGTVASLAPHKNHALLLEAAATVCAARPDVHFAWLGEGGERASLERRRAALGLGGRVHLLGFRPDARALMRQFDLFCLSSHLEGLCTSLLDAQALGVPIVATAVGGVPEVVRDGVTGRLVTALEPGAVANALLSALDAPADRERWREAALEAVRGFSAARTAALTEAVYRDVLAGRAA